MNLYAAAPDTAVVLWKGYDNPLDLVHAATESIECNVDLMTAGSDLVAFVDWLDLSDEQSLTVVAHSFGSVVTGTALADSGLHCTDVVVAGSPGMTVDELRQLHVDSAHFFSEKAPGDTVAELGIFGAAPTSSAFGGTRMRPTRRDTSRYWPTRTISRPVPRALENMVAVVTGRYSDIHRHRVVVPEIAGGLVAWTLRLPTMPAAGGGPPLPRPRFPGHGQRAMRGRPRGGANRNLVCEFLDEGERALRRFAPCRRPPDFGAGPAGRPRRPDPTLTPDRPDSPDLSPARHLPPTHRASAECPPATVLRAGRAARHLGPGTPSC